MLKIHLTRVYFPLSISFKVFISFSNCSKRDISNSTVSCKRTRCSMSGVEPESVDALEDLGNTSSSDEAP